MNANISLHSSTSKPVSMFHLHRVLIPWGEMLGSYRTQIRLLQFHHFILEPVRHCNVRYVSTFSFFLCNHTICAQTQSQSLEPHTVCAQAQAQSLEPHTVCSDSFSVSATTQSVLRLRLGFWNLTQSVLRLRLSLFNHSLTEGQQFHFTATLTAIQLSTVPPMGDRITIVREPGQPVIVQPVSARGISPSKHDDVAWRRRKDV